MSEPRKKWQEAKSKVKEKGWESKVKFQSDLGPDMDTLGALLNDVFNQLPAMAAKVEKAALLANKVSVTAKGYRSTIMAAGLTADDKKTLAEGLGEALKLARFAATNVQMRLEKAHKSAGAAIAVL